MKKQKLPKRFKAKWIKALRSGRFNQGRVYLNMNNLYCCLGVACIVAGHTKKKINGLHYISQNKKYKVPKILQGKEGLPKLIAGLNDDKFMTFPEIADWIEEYL